MSGGSANTPAPVNTYSLQNQPGADTNAYSGAGQIASMPNYALGNYNAINPQLTSQTQTAGAADQTAGQAVTGATNNAGLLGAAQQTLNTAYDPQNALYDRTYQQLQDQTGANNAANGLTGSPYGAGVQNQAASNFNIDWQNNQLQRQQTGASTAEGLLGQYNTGQSTGAGLQSTGVNTLASGMAASDAGAEANTAQPQQTYQDYLAYLNQGNADAGTSVSNYSAQSGTALQQQANNNSALGGIGSLFGTLGGAAMKANPALAGMGK